jgi:TPR repeat protein
MAPPRSAYIITIAAIGLAAATAPAQNLPHPNPSPQAGEGREGDARSIEEDLSNGRFAHLAALLARKANAGDAEAQYQLASLYRTGRGVPPDEALAFKWMKAAAEQGHVRAQFNLGAMYLSGRGVARDLNQGRSWLSKAAAQGSQDASLLLSSPAARPTKEAEGV